MPIVFRDRKQRPRLLREKPITRMTMEELIAYESYLWTVLQKLPDSPKVITTMNSIYREVEWRAQDTQDR